MNVHYLERDPYYRHFVQDRFDSTYPELKLQTHDSELHFNPEEDDLLIYTAEQFPSYHPEARHVLRLHSQRPDLDLTSDELLDGEDPAFSQLTYRSSNLSEHWTTIDDFLKHYHDDIRLQTRMTLVSIASFENIRRILPRIVQTRARSCDHLLVLPVMPSYLWSLLVTPEEHDRTLSDLLLQLSIVSQDASKISVHPYLCPSHLNCLTFFPPRQCDDLTSMSPEGFRRLLTQLRSFIEEGQPETWEVLILTYSCPIELVRVSMAMADNFYQPDRSEQDPIKRQWSFEMERLLPLLRSDARLYSLSDLSKGSSP